jgi:hypothetical protein
MHRTSGLLVAGWALALASLAPAVANDPYAGLDLLWVRPAREPGAPLPCARMLVLTLPRDWVPGDAAAAIVADEDSGEAVRSLAEALHGELTAVLVVPSRAVQGCPVRPAAPLAEVLGAVRALRIEAGAGLVIAIGLGSAGPAVLAATREEVAARLLGADGPRLAAAIALDGAAPAGFAIGSVPDGASWETRAPLLCAALASATDRLRLGACLAGLGVEFPMAGATRPSRH